jgi:hypothetical protein
MHKDLYSDEDLLLVAITEWMCSDVSGFRQCNFYKRSECGVNQTLKMVEL